MKNIILLCSLLFFIVGCGPELTLHGSKVQVGKESELKRCRLLGSTRVSLGSAHTQLVKDEKIKNRLIIEARNFTARIGGNMVLPVGAIEEGKQSFKIYNCPIYDD